MQCTFSSDDVLKANEEWGCNCGPAALAFALQVPLESVRDAIPKFDDRRYTNITMMKAALDGRGKQYASLVVAKSGRGIHPGELLRADRVHLIRVQWTGPWIGPDGKATCWAARQSHWIAFWYEGSCSSFCVFDINSGVVSFNEWRTAVVPRITATIDRADGGWFPTNVLSLLP